MFDDRLGYSTHFDQGLSLAAIPLIAASGVGWIRDDFNWAFVELTQGVYQFSHIKPFWLAAQAAGLKTVAIIEANPLYANPYDPTAMTNFCVWLAQQNAGINAFEITNEPNNIGQFQGTNGQAALVSLTNQIRAAVNAVNPSIPVIGLDEQGSEIIQMLALNPVIDGVVYHPYDAGDNVPEHVFEPPFTAYLDWVSAVRAATSLPIWETERNASSGSEFESAVWNARRLITSLGIGIDHSFIYTFSSSSTSQSVFDGFFSPRQTYYVLQRILSALTNLTSTGQGANITPGSSDFDVADLYSYTFSGASSSVATVWLGNHSPKSPPASGSATIAFPATSVTSASKVVDTVRGIELPLSVYRNSFSGGILSVFNFPVDDHPRLIIAQ